MGPELPRRASLDPADDPAFWYVIDRAITYQSSRPLFGPPPRDLFHPPPLPALLDVLVSAVEAQAAAHWVAARFTRFQPVVCAAASTYEHGRAAANRLIAEEVHELLDFVLERLLAMQAAGVSETLARLPDDLGLSPSRQR